MAVQRPPRGWARAASARDDALDPKAEGIGSEAILDPEHQVDPELGVLVLRRGRVLGNQRTVELLARARRVDQVVEREEVVAVALQTADLRRRLNAEAIQPPRGGVSELP